MFSLINNKDYVIFKSNYVYKLMTDMGRLNHCWLCLKASRIKKAIPQHHIIQMIYLNVPLTKIVLLRTFITKRIQIFKLTTIQLLPSTYTF